MHYVTLDLNLFGRVLLSLCVWLQFDMMLDLLFRFA